ncbi:hypothetical protein BJX66DRAFT_345493 [Aspergillus keveii]|uniref:ATPase AAA-type core domain-containing protein n=1 Tax=Aspergillus keveii TaxID=714993 RepID=A0ABR4FHV8_9EURO
MRQTYEDAEHDEQDSDIEADNDKQPPNRITLSAFLNIIDGLTAQEGRSLIMTANAVEKLDHALLRPGRVGLKVKSGCADAVALQEHFLVFFMQPVAAHVMGDLDSCGRMMPYSSPAAPNGRQIIPTAYRLCSPRTSILIGTLQQSFRITPGNTGVVLSKQSTMFLADRQTAGPFRYRLRSTTSGLQIPHAWTRFMVKPDIILAHLPARFEGARRADVNGWAGNCFGDTGRSHRDKGNTTRPRNLVSRVQPSHKWMSRNFPPEKATLKMAGGNPTES